MLTLLTFVLRTIHTLHTFPCVIKTATAKVGNKSNSNKPPYKHPAQDIIHTTVEFVSAKKESSSIATQASGRFKPLKKLMAERIIRIVKRERRMRKKSEAAETQ